MDRNFEIVRAMIRVAISALLFLISVFSAPNQLAAQLLDQERLSKKVEPPFVLNERLNDDGVWSIKDLTGDHAGYIFQTRALAPLPGFSGEPIDVLVTLDRDGQFLGAELIEHNEPIFVSGLGHAPFHEFMRQYRGLSVFDPLTVGVPYGAGDRESSSSVYLDGVTKATASVRIAHESILAASLQVVRQQMQGLAGGPTASPIREEIADLNWDALVAQGIAHRFVVTNAEIEAVFADSLWEDDDPDAKDAPEQAYLDLWIVDIGPDSVARAVLDEETLAQRETLMAVADYDEPILLLANGRHGLVSEEFVRNTAPDRLSLNQNGLPLSLRDGDIEVELADGVPHFEQRMIVRTDRRMGFDPTSPWELTIQAVRRHGVFRPETGIRELVSTQAAPERFFQKSVVIEPKPVWVESILARTMDLSVLGIFLVGLGGALLLAQSKLAALRFFTPIRLGTLAFMIGFIGWWGQGQLSIVTVIGTMRTALEGESFVFLLYDPFSLLIWAIVIVSFVLWGRGLFCGWLCPYGAMQELSHHLGKALGLKQIRVPERWDGALKLLKYGILAALLGSAFWPVLNDKLVEVEPFKTAVTTIFVREWYYVAYAAFWLLLSMMLFKGFCRYVCPLGAFLAIGGLLRGRDWIKRRNECGSPCQLCKVRCKYDAISPAGKIEYSECFQCLDCVTIHDDPKQCVPLILAAKNRPMREAAE